MTTRSKHLVRGSLLGLVLAAVPCAAQAPRAVQAPASAVSTLIDMSEPNAAGVQFQLVRWTGSAAALNARYGGRHLDLIEKLNRRDRNHIRGMRVLVLPAEWQRDERDYAPLPRVWEAASGYRKILVVHHPSQTFGAYQRGQLVRWGPVSSGRRTDQTPAGFYHLTLHDTGHTSNDNDEWFLRWYFQFEPKRGLSFHEYALPGYPASHACERLLPRDARWLYGWGDQWRRDRRTGRVLAQGTPLLIVGSYAFGAPPPWQSAGWLSRTIDLPDPPPPLSMTASVVRSGRGRAAPSGAAQGGTSR